MSIALDLKLTKSIPIGSVLPEAGKALREILALTYTPLVMAEMIGRNEALVDTYLIEPSSDILAVKMENEPEVATIIPYTLDFPEEKAYVAVSPQTWRTPLEMALVAAVAIAFGRYLKEEINDSASFYSTELSQSATRLAERLRLNRSFDDYRLAAQEFYNKLPKAMVQT